MIIAMRRRRSASESEPQIIGSCPIREHTGDGIYVGRCEFAMHDGYCPRHGAVEDYPNLDDRDIQPIDRRLKT
jgi:hypothetical protein